MAYQATKVYGRGDNEVRALDSVDVDLRRLAVHRHHGPIRLRQVDADALRRRSRHLDQRSGVHRRHRPQHAERPPTHRAATRPGRLHLPGLQPRPDADRHREHHAAADARRSQARPRLVAVGDRHRRSRRSVVRHRPSELSGGQQQRVAVARALASRPEIIFADEPTGNLDSQTGAEILSFMRRAVREMGQTIVMVTHDPVAASYADRALFLADGRIVDDMANPTSDMVLDRIKQSRPTPSTNHENVGTDHHVAPHPSRAAPPRSCDS